MTTDPTSNATTTDAATTDATGKSYPTGKILASPCLNFHNSYRINAPLIGCIPYHKIISINCTMRGDNVTGPYGTENIWDHTTYGGKSGYVADAWVYTGSNGAVAPACNASREQRAVNWLNGHKGSTGYNGLCELMVENAYGTSGRYSSALANYNAQKAAGRIHTDTNPPAGALVFARGTNPSLGHVMISNGDGRFWTSDGTIHLVSPITWAGKYYGWSYAPSSWPGA